MIRFIVDGTKYDFDDDKLSNVEAIALKKVSGLMPDVFFKGINEVDPEAITALVWLAKRRAGEHVKYGGLEFDLLQVMESLDEIDEMGRVVTRTAGKITHLDGVPVSDEEAEESAGDGPGNSPDAPADPPTSSGA